MIFYILVIFENLCFTW